MGIIMWKPKILFWPSCWLSNHIEMNRHHVGAGGLGGVGPNGKNGVCLLRGSVNFNPTERLPPPPQRACYLSLNPQKDETLETEKAQYVLPDGSTLNVSPAATLRTDFPQRGRSNSPLTDRLVSPRSGRPGSERRSCSSDPT